MVELAQLHKRFKPTQPVNLLDRVRLSHVGVPFEYLGNVFGATYPAKRYLDAALTAYHLGDYDKTVKYCNDVQRNEPDNSTLSEATLLSLLAKTHIIEKLLATPIPTDNNQRITHLIFIGLCARTLSKTLFIALRKPNLDFSPEIRDELNKYRENCEAIETGKAHEVIAMLRTDPNPNVMSLATVLGTLLIMGLYTITFPVSFLIAHAYVSLASDPGTPEDQIKNSLPQTSKSWVEEWQLKITKEEKQLKEDRAENERVKDALITQYKAPVEALINRFKTFEVGFLQFLQEKNNKLQNLQKEIRALLLQKQTEVSASYNPQQPSEQAKLVSAARIAFHNKIDKFERIISDLTWAIMSLTAEQRSAQHPTVSESIVFLKNNEKFMEAYKNIMGLLAKIDECQGDPGKLSSIETTCSKLQEQAQQTLSSLEEKATLHYTNVFASIKIAIVKLPTRSAEAESDMLQLLKQLHDCTNTIPSAPLPSAPPLEEFPGGSSSQSAAEAPPPADDQPGFGFPRAS